MPLPPPDAKDEALEALRHAPTIPAPPPSTRRRDSGIRNLTPLVGDRASFPAPARLPAFDSFDDFGVPLEVAK